jgi:hypothetical protein
MSMTEFMACFPEVYGVTANADDGEPVQRVFTTDITTIISIVPPHSRTVIESGELYATG